MFQILQVDPSAIDVETRDSATLPMSLGGLGIRSAVRTCKAAHWASWADCLPMILERHPGVANIMVEQLEHPRSPCFVAVGSVVRDLTGVGGFVPPSWRWESDLNLEHQRISNQEVSEMGNTRPRRVLKSLSAKPTFFPEWEKPGKR